MSGAPGSRWQRLLDQRKVAFLAHGYAIPINITCEDTFRTHFEGLCRNHREGYYTRFLAKLRLGRVDAFTRAVDATYHNAGPDTVTSLLFGILFVAFQCAIEAGIPLADAAKLLGELNIVVPSLGADIPRFPDNQKLEEALQEMFSTYMDSLSCMVSNFSLSPGAPDFNGRLARITINIEESRMKFEKARAAFAQFLEEAEQMRQQETTYTPNASSSHSGIVPNSRTHLYNTQMQYIPLRRLGRGSFGEVDEVEESTTGQVYARKNISLLGAASGRQVDVLNEVHIMQKLCHHHIASISFYKIEENFFSIFMKPAGDCDLWQYLENCTQKEYDSNLLRHIFLWFGCLLDALAFAHIQTISHRDIKPSNILIKNHNVYLADFGLAKDFKYHGTSQSSNFFVCGTPVYRAPEVRPDVARGTKGDVFSLGCVFSEMLTICGGRSLEDFRLFRRAQAEEYYDMFAFRSNLPKVRQWVNQLREKSNDAVLDDLSHQILSMLSENHERRKTAQQGVAALMIHRSSLFCPNHY